jgi:hypothetical protein
LALKFVAVAVCLLLFYFVVNYGDRFVCLGESFYRLRSFTPKQNKNSVRYFLCQFFCSCFFSVSHHFPTPSRPADCADRLSLKASVFRKAKPKPEKPSENALFCRKTPKKRPIFPKIRLKNALFCRKTVKKRPTFAEKP